jgi:transcriptional antiterminator RfaH
MTPHHDLPYAERAQDVVLDEAPRWLVAHVRPRCEKKFAALMRAENFPHELPLLEVVHKYESGLKRSTRPLLPGYVFAQVPLARLRRCYQQDLVARLLPVPATEEPRFLRQIDSLKRVAAAGIAAMLAPLLTKGRRVRVKSGPLFGVEGVIHDFEDRRGIIVAMDVIQQGLLVPISIEELEPLG